MVNLLFDFTVLIEMKITIVHLIDYSEVTIEVDKPEIKRSFEELVGHLENKCECLNIYCECVCAETCSCNINDYRIILKRTEKVVADSTSNAASI